VGWCVARDAGARSGLIHSTNRPGLPGIAERRWSAADGLLPASVWRLPDFAPVWFWPSHDHSSIRCRHDDAGCRSHPVSV